MRGTKRVPLPITLAASLFIAALPLPGLAQQEASAAFEVSSVKVSPPDAWQNVRRVDVGIVSLAGMTLKDLIAMCFYLRPSQIIGGPDWIARQRFDIVGKDSSTNISTTRKLDRDTSIAVTYADMVKLRGLLKDRFALQFHDETRLIPGFVLLKVKGSKFDAKPCSATYQLQEGWVDGEIRMASLAALLKADMGAPIEDKTGLAGCYHLQARWTTDPSDTSLPQLPTALRDLGLRIQKAKLNVNVLVIDHAELPKPD